MKTKLTKIICTALSLLLVGGASAGIAVMATQNDSAPKSKETSASGSTANVGEKPQKNETVYVLAGADGSVKKIIVSDWIKNVLGDGKLNDASDLSGIENVKGDEGYTMGGGNTKVWDAEGNDIYYRGNIDRELPVSVKISYALDGKPVSADEIAGKSGNVTVRFDYTNNQYKTVTIDRKEETIYVPFAMLTGMLLDNDVFTDITVTGGRLVNDGDRTAVVGVAFPGLRENLGLTEEQLPLPSYVEIRAKAKNFRLATTVSVATNEPFSKIDTGVFEDATTTVEEKLSALSGAMTQLLNGSSRLYDGVSTLLEQSGALISGIGQIADGLKQLNGNSETLRSGAGQVFDSLLATAQNELAKAGVSVTLTTETYAAVLDGVIASLKTPGTEEHPTAHDSIVSAVTAAVREQVTDKVTEAYRAGILTKVLSAQGMTAEQYQAALAAGMISAEVQDKIDAAVYLQMKKTDTQTAVSALVDAQMAGAEVQARITQNVTEQVAARVEQIEALKQQLTAYNTFYTGVNDYTAGVDAAYAGMQQLVSELPKLTDGIDQLKDGAGQLKDGLGQFNEEVVKKLTDLASGDIRPLLIRLRATIDVSKSYQSFAGIGEGMDGQVKFIYRTDSIQSK